MKNLLHIGISRCNNEKCAKRTTCKRFLQLEIDWINRERFAPCTKFDEADCEFYIENKVKK